MKKSSVIIGLLTFLVTMLVFSSTALADETLFMQPYDESKYNLYLGEVCTIDQNGGLLLDSSIQKIVNDPRYQGNISVTITKDNKASATVMVNDEGLKRLKQLSRDIYDTVNIKNKVKSMGQNINISADTDRAAVMLSGLEPLISLIVGILAYLVVVGMTFFTAMDICYITMPIFRSRMDEMKQTGNSMMVRQTRDGDVKLRWVSDEAQYAVMTCTIETGRNPLTVYLQKRIFAYIMVAVVIYLLLTGNIQLIVNIAINFVSGILRILSELGR